MANPEHVEILNRGVEVWNTWRAENPSDTPDLSYLNLEMSDFLNANFDGVNFLNTDFREANLSGSTFRHAMLDWVELGAADLSDADLTDASLMEALLASTTLTRTNISLCSFGGTIIADCDLSNVIGIDTTKHYGLTSLDIGTIYKSNGRIPESFLRGCGVPENFITYMRSLTVAAFEFYKCFISFTEADDAFSERLYNDLQGAGVRCWRWKEDAKWGKTLMRSIDEAVRVYDKLIVICSEQSLNAPTVIREIERALQKEDDLAREGKDAEVLFPIRLDDYIFTGWRHHRKADVTAKNVGDFRQWKQHDSYLKAFERLLRDLKAEDGEAAEA
jgi:uncharacterized protein YjbI with pentapeptide repeats